MIKHLISLAVSLVIALSPIFAQSKKEIKEVEKHAKALVKQFEKEGFEFLEIGMTPQELVENFLYGARFGHKQVIGLHEGAKSKSLAITAANKYARAEYASKSSAEVRRNIESLSSELNGDQVDNILDAYKEQSNKHISGELNDCFTIVRENEKGYDARVYYLVDHESAHAADMRAMKRALEVLELTQDYGDMITEWID